MQDNGTVSTEVAEGGGSFENVAVINWAPPAQDSVPPNVAEGSGSFENVAVINWAPPAQDSASPDVAEGSASFENVAVINWAPPAQDSVSLNVAEGTGSFENVAVFNLAPPVIYSDTAPIIINEGLSVGAPVYIQLKPAINVIRNNVRNAYVIDTLGVVQNASVNYTFQEQIANTSRLCGYPLFLDKEMCESDEELSFCTKSWAAVIFGVIVALLAAGIISVNALILALVKTNSTMKTQHHIIKASMAMADCIVGIILLFTVLPAIAWTPSVTLDEFVAHPRNTINSPVAIFFGALLNISVLGSMYHLLFLSVERFAAIRWPFRHRKRTTRSLIYSLFGLWVVTIALAITPAAFPEHFAFQFQPPLLIYMMTLQSYSTWRGPLYGAVTILVPYATTVCFCIATAIDISQKMKKTRKRFGSDHKQDSLTQQGPRKNEVRRDISVFVTLSMMITVFTATLLPFIIVIILFAAGLLHCNDFEGYYVATYYIGLLNNLANGVIYNIRDGKFRKAAWKLLCGKCSKQSQPSEEVSTSIMRSSTH